MGSLRLTGHDRLIRILDGLGKDITKIVRPAVNAALTPINKAAKRGAPVDTGILKKSIGKKVKTYKRTGIVMGMVGARGGFRILEPGRNDGRERIPVFYHHLAEDQKPHLRPALDANRTRAVRILGRKIIEGIRRRAKA